MSEAPGHGGSSLALTDSVWFLGVGEDNKREMKCKLHITYISLCRVIFVMHLHCYLVLVSCSTTCQPLRCLGRTSGPGGWGTITYPESLPVTASVLLGPH